MAQRNRSRRVTSISPTAWGSGAKLTDLFPLPPWLFIFLKLITYVFRFWYLTVAFLLLVLLNFNPTIPLLIVLLVPVVFYLNLYRHNRHHTPSAVARAALLLARSRARWQRACQAAQVNDGPHTPKLSGRGRPVRIANDQGTALEFTLDLSRTNQTVSALEQGKDYFTSVLKARNTRVNRLTAGTARLIIEWERDLTRAVINNPINQINATQLPRAELDQNVLLELDTSVLVVGESGSGKSNLTWNILNNLNDNGTNYRLYVIDPKKVELAALVDSPFTQQYSDSPKTADDVIKAFHTAMMGTFEWMKKQSPPLRKVVLGHHQNESPLNILIIDEMLLCKQATKGIDTDLGEILSAGRAAGFIVIANSQLGQVDAISRLRDLFPQRICMAVKSQDLTNAVLGPRAEERGARCTEITEKGVGYIYTDFAGSFQRFKPPFIGDIQTVAEGKVWRPEQPPLKTISSVLSRTRKTCYTYRLYNRSGILLYVGKALNPNKRITQHVDKPFYNDIDHGRTIIRKYPSEAAAFEAETEAIHNEHPRYNISQSTHSH